MKILTWVGIFLFVAATSVAVVYYLRFQELQAQLSQVTDQQSLYTQNMSEQQQELEFLRLKSAGDDFFLKGDYRQAKQYYQQAEQLKEQSSDLLETRKKMHDSIAAVKALTISALDSNQFLASRLAEKADSVELMEQYFTKKESQLRKEVDELQNKLGSAKDSVRRYAQKYEEIALNRNVISFTTAKGSKVYYVGDMNEGKAHGMGVGIFLSGGTYRGEWQNNMRHGVGRYEWADGEWYEGDYKSGFRDGFGVYYWVNGEKYRGQWKHDKRHGKGTMYDSEGEELSVGVWKEDKLVESFAEGR